METTYREQLDEMLNAQFGPNPDAYLMLTPREKGHGKHGLRVFYKDGHINVVCAKCGSFCAHIKVANEPATSSLSA